MQTIFLSTVTAEYGPIRRRLANLTQRTKKCLVRHQDDFFHRGVKTLQKLAEEVQESDLVVHVIGVQSGWCIPADQAETFLDDDKHRGFETRFPAVARQARSGSLPATQWEAWLGLYFGKRLISFYLQTPDMDDLQNAHLHRLNQIEEHPDKVDRPETLFDEIVGSLITLGVFTQEDVRRPIHLPYSSIGSLFKGRDEFLAKLRSSLQRSGEQHASAITGKALHGLGGAGKTRLAVEYAWQHANDYSAVLFVTADSPENLRRNLAELVGPMVLDLEEQAATEEEVRVAGALRWLAEHPGWFLILDNVDTEEAAEFVEQLLPKLQEGHVLITSRLGRWSDSVEPLELDVLAYEDGAQFLIEKTERRRKKTASDDADALELAKELDGLALALEQAGAYIGKLRKSIAEYLELWRAHRPKVQEWLDRTIKYAGPTGAPMRSVAVTWQTTLEQLGEDERALMDLLAWFAPEPVPLSVLSPSTLSASLRSKEENGNTEVAEDAEDQGEAWDRERLEAALANLSDFSMTRWDAVEETVTVHRVVQEILRTQQSEPQENLTTVLQWLNDSIPEGHPGDVRTWPAWEPLRPHVGFAVEEGKRLAVPVPTSRLMGELGTLLWAKALHYEAEALERDALSIDEQHYGSDSTEVATRLNNLAQTLKATNRLAEAEPLMRRALAIDEASYGAEHPSVAIRLNNLAALLHATNRLSEAEPLMRRGLAIEEKSKGTDHPHVAIQLNNLAQLLQATNRLSEAEPLMRRAISIDEASYGVEHPNVAIRLNNLAQLLKARAEGCDSESRVTLLAEAEPLMRRALAIFQNSLGADHPNTQGVARNLEVLVAAIKGE